MQLSEETIVSNWNSFLDVIKSSFTGIRREALLDFYNKYEDRFALMPASGKVSFHNAFPGGYVDHVLNVYNNSIAVKKVWEEAGALINFTDEELAMVAINHDLGKFGIEEHEYYIDQDSKWHKDRGEIYKHNPAMQFMKTSDRSLYLLQHIGVELTQNEWIGITLHDGLYEEANKSYYISYNEDYRLRSNLPYIVHQADLLAARVEHDRAYCMDKIISGKIIVHESSKKIVEGSTRSNVKVDSKNDKTKSAPPPQGSPPPVKSNSKYSKLLGSL